MSGNRPRAILLDLDGTLADSLPVMKLAYRRFVERSGATPSDAEFASLNGPPLGEVVGRLKRAHAMPGDEAELLSCYQAVLDELYRQVAPAAGAQEFLAGAQRRGWRTGVVTSNSRARATSWLATARLLPLVDFVVAAEDVARGKPAPEAYLRAVERAAVPANTVIAVEDSAQGAQSARSAGLRTFVIAPATGEDTWPPGCVAVRSLRELSELLW